MGYYYIELLTRFGFADDCKRIAYLEVDESAVADSERVRIDVCWSVGLGLGTVDIIPDPDEMVAIAAGFCVPHRPQGERVLRPLRLVQISDPHLGPFMSVARLRAICERAVAAQPDLVLLTGDFLTMESQSSVEPLRQALAPLAALPGRVYACRGNHDLEAPAIVDAALRHNGIRLLVDEAATAKTPWGEVELLGFDFTFREREAHLNRVTARHPRRGDRLRIALLHDPSAFRFLPPAAADLVLSGHTHGGQLGLVSIGGSWTVPRLVDVPDHGLWARGRNRMYIHRGTGHYGFPLRLGVPAEEGVIHVHWQPPGATSLAAGGHQS